MSPPEPARRLRAGRLEPRAAFPPSGGGVRSRVGGRDRRLRGEGRARSGAAAAAASAAGHGAAAGRCRRRSSGRGGEPCASKGFKPFPIRVQIVSATDAERNVVRYGGEIDCSGTWTSPRRRGPAGALLASVIDRGRGGGCKGAGNRVGPVRSRAEQRTRLGYALRGGGVESRGVLSRPSGAGRRKTGRTAELRGDLRHQRLLASDQAARAAEEGARSCASSRPVAYGCSQTSAGNARGIRGALLAPCLRARSRRRTPRRPPSRRAVPMCGRGPTRADVLNQDVAGAVEGGGGPPAALWLNGLVDQRAHRRVRDVARSLVRLSVDGVEQVRVAHAAASSAGAHGVRGRAAARDRRAVLGAGSGERRRSPCAAGRAST